MPTHILLLRGINVGGKNIVRMAELRATLGGIGLDNVRTYIQSGNVVFETGRIGKAALRAKIEDAVSSTFGVSPSLLLLTKNDLSRALENNPFAGQAAQDNQVHCFFLASVPRASAVRAAAALAATSESCAADGRVFYLFAPDGIARSELAVGAEKALGVAATARNVRSVRKILDLAERAT